MDPDLLIIFGSIILMMTIPMVFALVKKWIDRNNNSYDEQAFDRLAKAFIQYKKESERRFQNLEAIISEDESTSSRSKKSDRKLERPQLHNTIEIETDTNKSSEKKEKKDNRDSNSGNLRNMLKE